MKLPQIKKKVSAYILGEEGRIAKQSLISLGALLGTVALGTILASQSSEAGTSVSHKVTHSNNPTLRVSGTTGIGRHGHHSNHASHTSHGSY